MCLPETLDATYDRILLNIDEDYWHLACIALQFLACSARPLTLQEVAEAVAVVPFCKPVHEYIDEHRLFDPEDILTICSTLITVDETHLVRLAHYSVREYLVSDRIRYGPAATARFAIQEPEANRFVAEVCLSYLLSFDEPDSIYGNVLDHFPLLDYSASYWFVHTSLKCNESETRLSNACLRLFATQLGHAPHVFVNWLKIFNPEARYVQPEGSVGKESYASALYYATLIGKAELVSLVLRQSVDVDAVGGAFDTPLKAAAILRHTEVLSMLLDAGADVNITGGNYPTVIHAAAYGGDVGIIRTLLDAGAKLVWPQDGRGSPLDSAVYGGNADAFRYLVELKGNSSNGYGADASALLFASITGRSDLVGLLLAAGADPDARLSSSPLQAAAYHSRDLVVETLVRNGANVNERDHANCTPLQSAAATWGRRNLKILKLLIEAGADVNAPGGPRYGTALQAATSNGWTEAVQLLLESGALMTERERIWATNTERMKIFLTNQSLRN